MTIPSMETSQTVLFQPKLKLLVFVLFYFIGACNCMQKDSSSDSYAPSFDLSELDLEWTAIVGAPVIKKKISDYFVDYLDIVGKYPEFMGHFEPYRAQALRFIELYLAKASAKDEKTMIALENLLLTKKLQEWWQADTNIKDHRVGAPDNPDRFLRIQLGLKIERIEKKFLFHKKILKDYLAAATILISFHPKVVRVAQFLSQDLELVDDPIEFMTSTLLYPLKHLIDNYRLTATLTKDEAALAKPISYKKLAARLTKARCYSMSYRELKAIQA